MWFCCFDYTKRKASAVKQYCEAYCEAIVGCAN